MADLLAVAGVEFSGASHVEVGEQGIRLHPKGRWLRVERVVALPLVRRPELEGVPADPDSGFIPVDEHGRVEGLDDVYCAGDATNFPIKQGGLAAQQADAVAEQIAALIGAEWRRPRFGPSCAACCSPGMSTISCWPAGGRGTRGQATALVAPDQDRGALSRALPL